MARSTRGLIVVLAVAVLLVESDSVSWADTVAVFSSVPRAAGPTSTPIVTVVEAPGARLPNCAVTVPLLWETVPWPAEPWV